ncbi:MAG: hypothetical protein P794_05010 [Epsilonproteobacteria bacterium (ex Lamellibrachia satsuma)]|nr:MAG: hypothetical protein P794_05010 [Epsilonproteobacteria bacterium (ex Lamellibrachia satsuma)]
MKIIVNKIEKNTKNTKIYTPKYKAPYRKKTSYKEKIIKGANFEKYVARYYDLLDYKIIEHGKIYGKKDQGIDIIAINEKETILIQCKNYNNNHKWKIRQKDIKAFRMNCIDFVNNNPEYKKKNTNILFITSNDILDAGAKKYIKEKRMEGKKIDYKIIDYY